MPSRRIKTWFCRLAPTTPILRHRIRSLYRPPACALAPIPNSPDRRIFVAFRSVTINGMNIVNGGTASDIRFSPGLNGRFNPNIEQVTLDRIHSAPRVKPKRHTIEFADLAAGIAIGECQL